MDLGVIGFCQTIYRVHKGQDNWLHVHSFEMLYISDSADSDLCAVHFWHQYENVKAFLLYFQSTLTKASALKRKRTALLSVVIKQTRTRSLEEGEDDFLLAIQTVRGDVKVVWRKSHSHLAKTLHCSGHNGSLSFLHATQSVRGQ